MAEPELKICNPRDPEIIQQYEDIKDKICSHNSTSTPVEDDQCDIIFHYEDDVCGLLQYIVGGYDVTRSGFPVSQHGAAFKHETEKLGGNYCITDAQETDYIKDKVECANCHPLTCPPENKSSESGLQFESRRPVFDTTAGPCISCHTIHPIGTLSRFFSLHPFLEKKDKLTCATCHDSENPESLATQASEERPFTESCVGSCHTHELKPPYTSHPAIKERLDHE